MINMKKCFAFIVVTAPICSMYTITGGIDLDTLLCIAIFPFVLIYAARSRFPIRTSGILVALILYVIMTTVLNLAAGTALYSNRSEVILRCGRYVLIMSMVLVIGLNGSFDYRYAVRTLRIVTLLATAYILVQLLLYFATGFILPNEIGGGLTTNIYGTVFPRLGSFCNEPEEFVSYSSAYLCYCIFSDTAMSGKRLREAVFITLGILVSTSGLGLAVVMLFWVVMLGRKFMKSESFNKKRWFVLIGPPLILLFCVCMYFSPLLQFTLSRFFSPSSGAIHARIQGYYALRLLSVPNLLFGTGFGNYIDHGGYYFSSFSEILFCTGIVGLVIFLTLYIRLFLKGDLFRKMLVAGSLMLMIGGGLYTAKYLCLYLSLMMYGIYTDEKLPLADICDETGKAQENSRGSGRR